MAKTTKKMSIDDQKKPNKRMKIISGFVLRETGYTLMLGDFFVLFFRTKRKHQKSKQQQQHSYKNEGIRRPKFFLLLKKFSANIVFIVICVL